MIAKLGPFVLPATVAFLFLATAWPFPFEIPIKPTLTIVGWGFSTELDIVRNVLLFVPLGLALALSRSAPISTVRFTGFVLASSFSLA